MTVDEQYQDAAFKGVMRSLNLDEAELPPLATNFDDLSYEELEQTKIEIERQLSLLFEVLKNRYNADMSTELVSPDGFPRGDIDVVAIRLIRVKINRLRNDAKRVYSVIEKGLIERFHTAGEQAPRYNTISGSEELPEVSRLIDEYRIPFSVISEIDTLGPAYAAGLRMQDQIVAVESIHAGNHDNLREVQRKIAENIGKPVRISVLRDSIRHNLELIPRNDWGGRGVLGCRLVLL